LKYTANDTDAEGRPTPRGEIWARGPQIFQGYYKRDDLTRETINPEGWVKTGDVGMIVPNLGLKIIDRIKHIFKLQQG
jgi:long-chain acyl-CoA synthetase